MLPALYILPSPPPQKKRIILRVSMISNNETRCHLQVSPKRRMSNATVVLSGCCVLHFYTSIRLRYMAKSPEHRRRFVDSVSPMRRRGGEK